MDKEAFYKKKISLSISKLQLNSERNWFLYLSISLYGPETWTLRKLEGKCLEGFQMWHWTKLEKIKWPEKITNEQVLNHTGEIRRHCLLHDAIEE